MKFFPDFALKDLYVWLLVMNFLGLLAVMFPWELGKEADPLAPAPIGIKPEWYFLAMFQLLKLFPPEVGPIEGELAGILLFSLVGFLWVMIPFIDSRNAPVWRSRAVHYFGIALLAGIIFFTIWGHYS
jgi:cytochrome b6